MKQPILQNIPSMNLDQIEILAYQSHPFECNYIYLQILRDNGIDKVSDMCCRHLVRFFDSTGEGRLQYTE